MTGDVIDRAGVRDLKADVEAFILHEAALADGHRYEEWLALWEPDALYWVPIDVDADYVPGTTVSILRDDHARLVERVTRLRNPAVHSQVPRSHLCRLVANVVVADPGSAVAGGEVVVASRMHLDEVRRDRQELYSARVEHRLRRRSDGWGIVHKVVRLTRAHKPVGNLTFLL